MKVHSDAKDFSCDLCDKSYKYSQVCAYSLAPISLQYKSYKYSQVCAYYLTPIPPPQQILQVQPGMCLLPDPHTPSITNPTSTARYVLTI